MILRYLIAILCVGITTNFLSVDVFATTAKYDKGLTISPLRRELSVNANKSTKSFITITNSSSNDMSIDLSVKQFSVSDYSYDYVFKKSQYDWLKLRENTVTVKPNEQKKIWYDVTIPDKATPGGYYFSLFASTRIGSMENAQIIQVASLIYIKVDGKFIRTSVLQNSSVPFVVMNNQIPFQFDVKNTGNVHFSAYFFGQLQGIFGKMPERGTSHLLMPTAIRTIEGSVPSPLLPGVYKITYGYKVDYAQIIISESSYILYIPPWTILVVLFVFFSGKWVWKIRNNIILKKKTN